MKKIKIKICNYDQNDKCSYGFFITNILKKYYEVEISGNPEYLFFNESTNEHLNYDCIKIFYTGENIHTDFNFCDYAFGFDYINFSDRYCRLPIYMVAIFYRQQEILDTEKILLNQRNSFIESDLQNKKDFCSFVYSNYLADENRKVFFDLLNQYKKVNSGGAYLNNIGYKVDNKFAFEKKHKFSIAFEDSSNDGYTTEKLLNSIVSSTVPIYWGNPKIGKEFNTKRFINCHDYNSFTEVVEKIKEIDQNDELYIKIVKEPILNYENSLDIVQKNFESFLKNIFDQPIEKAKRIKINPARRKDLIAIKQISSKIWLIKNSIRFLLYLFYKPFKKIYWIDKLKHKILSSKKVT